jgi:hypothetical protein
MGISKLYITDTLIHYWFLIILIDLIPITTYINSYDFMVYEWYIYIWICPPDSETVWDLKNAGFTVLASTGFLLAKFLEKDTAGRYFLQYS